MKKIITCLALILLPVILFAQPGFSQETFTHADTLRGSITPERAWWDVQYYAITVKPDYASKTLAGNTLIRFKVVQQTHTDSMQIDLQAPLVIDSILFNSRRLTFRKADTNVWRVSLPAARKLQAVYAICVYYHGKPIEAIRPPWDGGWIWSKDSLGRPWMAATCQGLGASAWFPCKDHQSDEPDSGASLTMIVPDTLVAVGNGRLVSKKLNRDGTATYRWAVKSPINNYDIAPYIGKYLAIPDAYPGKKGRLSVTYWVLDYNRKKALTHMVPEVHRMLKAFEYWFGPYPFYVDGYQLVDAPYLGEENQSAIAYGNGYQNGYKLGNHWIDLSGTGWGLKWDFIIVHESGHEWFGNNITSRDIADMWLHEGFTNYSETLFTEYYYGREAADEYNYGLRKRITNKEPVITHYQVNEEPGIDQYYKGSNLLHTIRHSMDNDEIFRNILKGLNKTFYHQTVSSKNVEDYISDHAGFNYGKVFDQYLRTVQIPVFEIYFTPGEQKVSYRWTNCIPGFDLPLVLKNGTTQIKIFPTTNWQSSRITEGQRALFNPLLVEKQYYVQAKEVPGMD